MALVDLREKNERERHGVTPGALHAPYPDLHGQYRRGRHAARAGGARPASARLLLRLRRALGDGGEGRAGRRHSASACHIEGGIAAWKKAGGQSNIATTVTTFD